MRDETAERSPDEKQGRAWFTVAGIEHALEHTSGPHARKRVRNKQVTKLAKVQARCKPAGL